jgi:hypothetical protein
MGVDVAAAAIWDPGWAAGSAASAATAASTEALVDSEVAARSRREEQVAAVA